jgi:hypothetical protein
MYVNKAPPYVKHIFFAVTGAIVVGSLIVRHIP